MKKAPVIVKLGISILNYSEGAFIMNIIRLKLYEHLV